MWLGVDIDAIRKGIYGNFYSATDYAIIKGNDSATISEVKKVINKARKIGDVIVETQLIDMYDELLYKPNHRVVLPPRKELDERYAEILEQAE